MLIQMNIFSSNRSSIRSPIASKYHHKGRVHLENTVIFPENSEFWIPPLKESDAPIFSDQENQDWLRPPLFSGKKMNL